MKIFVSWSGPLSHRVATILRIWLPNVIQSVDAYVSSEDIDKGARWSPEIARELEASDFGIICVSKENLNAPWLLFEAGALSKKFERGRVSPFLIDLKISDISGPLAQFQATPFSKKDINKLMQSINKSAESSVLEDGRLGVSFDKWWPDLEKDLNEAITARPSANVAETVRPERDLLEEVVRNSQATMRMILDQQTLLLNRFSGNPPPPFAPMWPWGGYLPQQRVGSAGPAEVTQAFVGGKSWPGKNKLTPDQKKVLGHLYFEQAQTLDELSRHTELPAQYVIDIIEKISKMVSQKNKDGLYWAVVFDKEWARELAKEAGQKREKVK